MKVLVLASPLGGVGGIQRYSTCLVRALQDILGPQSVRCVAISDSAGRGGRGQFSVGLKARFACQAVWESLRWRPDLIVCAHLALGPVGRAASKLIHRPYWTVVYGIEAWGLLPKAKQAALRRADRVIAISGFSREQVCKQHAIDAQPIFLLPCMLDEALLRIKPAHDGAWAKIPPSRHVVISVARLAASERYKGHDVVLRSLPQVVKKLPDMTYVVVGDGDDRRRLERLAHELGMADHVLFAGEVSDGELAALYRQCDVFVLPARTVLDDREPKGEGFGIVFLEAMAFGKPVIGPDYGAPVEVIRQGETGLLVDPGDPAAVAEALLKLLTNPDLAQEMGRAGSEYVRKSYSYDSFRERLRGMLAAGTSEGHQA